MSQEREPSKASSVLRRHVTRCSLRDELSNMIMTTPGLVEAAGIIVSTSTLQRAGQESREKSQSGGLNRPTQHQHQHRGLRASSLDSCSSHCTNKFYSSPRSFCRFLSNSLLPPLPRLHRYAPYNAVQDHPSSTGGAPECGLILTRLPMQTCSAWKVCSNCQQHSLLPVVLCIFGRQPCSRSLVRPSLAVRSSTG